MIAAILKKIPECGVVIKKSNWIFGQFEEVGSFSLEYRRHEVYIARAYVGFHEIKDLIKTLTLRGFDVYVDERVGWKII